MKLLGLKPEVSCLPTLPAGRQAAGRSVCPSGEIPTDSIRGLKAAVLKRRDK